MNQLSHPETAFPTKKFPIVIILDQVSGPANVGSIFRLADAFNASQLVLCGNQTDLSSNRLLRTARSTVHKVAHLQQEDTLQVCRSYQEKGYHLMALEITRDSVPLESINYGQYEKIALVVGNEAAGISEQVLNVVNQKVHITMYGQNSSMNVAQATGIALYEISKSIFHFEQK